MRILLTGSTGFIGKHIYDVISKSNTVVTIGRKGCHIAYDFTKIKNDIPEADLLIHCAGLAHVHEDKYCDELIKVNFEYSVNLLKSINESKSSIRYLVLISSVSVYGPSKGNLINEKSELQPNSCYGISKLKCEEAFISWANRNSIKCTILRLPLVIGIGASGNLESMIKAIRKGYYFNVGKGDAKKSMVLVQDVADIIINASKVGGIYNLTDGYHPSFYELSNKIANQFGKEKVKSIPFLLAQALALLGNLIGRKSPLNSDKLSKLTSTLTYDDSSARIAINWNPTAVLEGLKVLNS